MSHQHAGPGIHVGTCSWTDPTLIEDGSFYPSPKMTAEERLKFYSSRFDVVEVDSSFYAIPSEKVVSLHASRTPPTFTLHYKAFGLLTQHSINPKALPKAIKALLDPALLEEPYLPFRAASPEALNLSFQMFSSALRPAQWARKLGVVLFQFSPSFRASQENLDYLLFCRAKLPDYALAVEFRHSSWLEAEQQDKTMDFLNANDLAYVSVDEPQFPSHVTVPPVARATTDVAYVRLHGRNTDTWFQRGLTTAQRFQYLYSEEELQEWVDRLDPVIGRTDETFIMFNNCYRTHAVRNAQLMKKLLRG